MGIILIRPDSADRATWERVIVTDDAADCLRTARGIPAVAVATGFGWYRAATAAEFAAISSAPEGILDAHHQDLAEILVEQVG